MAKYMEIAAQANDTAKELMDLIKGPLGSEEYGKAAEMIARLVNFGVRVSPRGVHSTIRYNAVKRAVEGLPVRVSMKEVKDERTGRTYNALVTVPLSTTADLPPTVEGMVEE